MQEPDPPSVVDRLDGSLHACSRGDAALPAPDRLRPVAGVPGASWVLGRQNRISRPNVDAAATVGFLAACHRMQTSLSFVEAGLSALQRALQDRGNELRNIQMATVSPEGRPDLRTLVLRDLQLLPASAEVHSDARAAKVRDIAVTDRVSLLAWSSADRLQLRLGGIARLHRGNDVARARWAALSPKARDAYGSQAIPGAEIKSPGDQHHLSPKEQFLQFTVILVSLDTVDVLRLEPDGGQTRASGRFTPAGIVACWVSP